MKIAFAGFRHGHILSLYEAAQECCDVEIVGCFEAEAEAMRAAKESHGMAFNYSSYDELLSDGQVEVVAIGDYYGIRGEMVIKALLAGKHVYSEKPLGADFEEGTELVRIAKERGLWIGGAPDTFMGAGIQTCRKFIDEGRLGDVIGGRCVMAHRGVESWHPDPDFYYQRGGGPLLDMGPYYITALINLLGEVKKVYGTSRTTFDERLITAKPHEGEMIKVNVPTHYECLLTFTSGATVSFMTTFDTYDAKQANIQLYGTKGNLYVPDPNCFGSQNGMRFLNGTTKEEEELSMEFDYSENSRCLGLAELAAAIEQGRTPRTSYLQTYHVLEVMTGIMKSAETGVPYEMSTHFEREAPMDPSLPHGIL